MVKMRSVEAHRAVSALNERLVIPLKDSQLSVLRVLADHASEKFECFPSLQTIAKKTGKSKRQVIRLLQGLRSQGFIGFDENRGGQGICNRYSLLFVNGDINSDGNGDTKGDIKGVANSVITNNNSDIWRTRTVSDFSQTVSKNATNGVIAMSPEWFNEESFLEWESEWKNLTPFFQGGRGKDFSSQPSKFLCYADVVSQVDGFEENPEDLLQDILKGIPIQRNQKCDHHGTFVRPGYRCGNWIAWFGHESVYSSTWTDDAGCQACKSEIDESWKDEPEGRRERFRQTLPVRRFDLKTPATCPDHGHFMFRANFTEFSEWYVQHGDSRFRVGMDYMHGCPGCDAELLEEEYVMEQLGLSWGEWERGGKRIIAAIDYAKEKPGKSESLRDQCIATVT